MKATSVLALASQVVTLHGELGETGSPGRVARKFGQATKLLAAVPHDHKRGSVRTNLEGHQVIAQRLRCP